MDVIVAISPNYLLYLATYLATYLPIYTYLPTYLIPTV